MTSLLLRHIFDATFHFRFPLKSYSQCMGSSHSVVLNLPCLLLAADFIAGFTVVLVATLVDGCVPVGSLLSVAVKTGWGMCATSLLISLPEGS